MCKTIKNGEFLSKQINLTRHDFQSLLSTYPLNVPWSTVELTCWNLDHLHLAYILYLGWQLWGPWNHLESETNSLAPVLSGAFCLCLPITFYNMYCLCSWYTKSWHNVWDLQKVKLWDIPHLKQSDGSQTVDDNLNDDRKPGKLFPKQPKQVHLRVLKR